MEQVQLQILIVQDLAEMVLQVLLQFFHLLLLLQVVEDPMMELVHLVDLVVVMVTVDLVQVEQVILLPLAPLKVVQVVDTSLVMELEVVAVPHKLEKMEELLV